MFSALLWAVGKENAPDSPAVQHAWSKWERRERCLKECLKEESKISFLMPGQKQQGRCWKRQLWQGWVVNRRGVAVAAGKGKGGHGQGKGSGLQLLVPLGISSVDCTVVCKNPLWLLHSHFLLVALFHMQPNMFFHWHADFELFCLDSPVEGLQLTQKPYQ